VLAVTKYNRRKVMRIAQLALTLLWLAGASLSAQVLTTPGKSNGTSTVGGPPRGNKILMLQGRILLDDGKAPSEPAVIERVCGTYVYKEGITNQEGEYSVQLGQNQGVLMDASASAGTLNNPSGGQGLTSDVSPNALWDCELRASLAGYRSDSISLENQRNLDSHVIDFVMHYIGDAKGSTISATSSQAPQAPKDAQRAYQKELDAVKAGSPDEAQKSFLKAVATYPRYAPAWCELAQLYERRGHAPEAKDAYTHALAGDPNYVNPYDKLYKLAVKESDWPQVSELTGKLLGLDPYDFANAYYYNARANLQADKLDAAVRSAGEAVKVTGPKADVRAHHALGSILGRKGDYPGAAAELRAFLQAAPNASNRAQVEEMIATAEGAKAQAKTAPAQR
jgi:tetratricopeptide (TPR) repeat protein